MKDDTKNKYKDIPNEYLLPPNRIESIHNSTIILMQVEDEIKKMIQKYEPSEIDNEEKIARYLKIIYASETHAW